jgi:hypothetical protein
MMRSLRSLVFVGLTLGALSAGCGKHVQLYAMAPTLSASVQVRLKEADISGDRVYVKMYMTNTSGDVLHIDRDGMSLRLPNGQVLPRSVGKTTMHKPYDVPPGQGHDVFVDFRADHDLADINGATVILGGCSIGSEAAHVIGELPLSTTYQNAPPPAADPAAPAPAAPPGSSAPAAPAQDSKDI